MPVFLKGAVQPGSSLELQGSVPSLPYDGKQLSQVSKPIGLSASTKHG